MSSAQLRGVTVDCDDPQSLARFYQELTGMSVGFSSDEYVALTGGSRIPLRFHQGLGGMGGGFSSGEYVPPPGGSGLPIGFQGVANYRAPQWPDQQTPQQLHLDFAIEDLDTAVDLMLSLGATRPEHQPGGDRYRVLLVPAGHPFCLLAP